MTGGIFASIFHQRQALDRSVHGLQGHAPNPMSQPAVGLAQCPASPVHAEAAPYLVLRLSMSVHFRIMVRARGVAYEVRRRFLSAVRSRPCVAALAPPPMAPAAVSIPEAFLAAGNELRPVLLRDTAQPRIRGLSRRAHGGFDAGGMHRRGREERKPPNVAGQSPAASPLLGGAMLISRILSPDRPPFGGGPAGRTPL